MGQQWKLMVLGVVFLAGVAQAPAQDWTISIEFGSQNGGLAFSYNSASPVYVVPRPVLVGSAPSAVCVSRVRPHASRVIYVTSCGDNGRHIRGHVAPGPGTPRCAAPVRLRHHPLVKVACGYR